jgi:hypothetical protein
MTSAQAAVVNSTALETTVLYSTSQVVFIGFYRYMPHPLIVGLETSRGSASAVMKTHTAFS